MANESSLLIKRLTAAEHSIEQLRTIDNHLTILPVSAYIHSPFPLTAAGTPYYPFAVTLPRDGRIVQFITAFYVDTTNNGGNFWTFTLEIQPTGASIQANSTAALSASTWTRIAPVFGFNITTASVSLQVKAQSTGAPGILYMAAPIIAMR